MAEAYAQNNADIITQLTAADAARLSANQLGNGLNQKLINQIKQNPEIFEKAAFETRSLSTRLRPNLQGNSVSEVAGKGLDEGGKYLNKNRDNRIIVKGAKLKCSCGNKESNIEMQQSHGVYINGSPALNATDKRVMENILDFGHCKTTNSKCVPSIVGEWNQVKDDVKINGQSVITMDSWLTCSRKGQIKLKASGQKNK